MCLWIVTFNLVCMIKIILKEVTVWTYKNNASIPSELQYKFIVDSDRLRYIITPWATT